MLEAMARRLSFPFRLLPNGRAATVEQGSVDGDRESIAQLILTRPGERPLRPGFGMTDPTFAGFEPTELTALVAMYGPTVDIVDVLVSAADDVSQNVDITFA